MEAASVRASVGKRVEVRSGVAWVRGALAAGALLVATTTASAGPYSSLYAFGDSLTDVGNDLAITAGAVPATAYYTDGVATGRFTNGLNYGDRLAASLGVGFKPSLQGGTDYAYGGARTTYITPDLVPLGGLSFNQQLASYYAGHAAADAGGLYLLWIGANDMADAIQKSALGSKTAVADAIDTAMAGIGAGIEGLASRGATHFLVPNLPDLSLTPFARSLAAPPSARSRNRRASTSIWH